MIRVVVFLTSVGLVALGVAWFADRPGDVAITWIGYRIETSVMVASVAVLLLVIAAMIVWTIARNILRSPAHVAHFMRERREGKGYLAITRGLIAVGAGDVRLARKSAGDAGRLLPHEPLALLLSAQSAQLSGDRPSAERVFRTMAERDDTRALGLRGLYIEAQRRDDAQAARHFAEEAAKSDPAPGWAGEAVLEDRSAVGDWEGALSALERMKSLLDKQAYRRQRAVLLTARAIALEGSDRDASRALVLEAVKLAPDLVPASALAGRRLAESNELRKARKILEAGWAATPHPEIAEAYANLRFGDSARDRLKRMQKLFDKAPQHVESALALARAALEAREFIAARAALKPHEEKPTRRVAALMAEIEEAEGNEGRAREWMARAVRAAPDPAWTADGLVSESWMPVSPVSGKLDAFQWKVPLAEIAAAQADNLRPAARAPIELPPPEKSATKPKAKSPQKRARPAVEPVIPLVHAPDDPGPEPMPIEQDPVPEPTVRSTDAWQRLRALFK